MLLTDRASVKPARGPPSCRILFQSRVIPLRTTVLEMACLEGSRLYGSTDETLELAQREGIVFQAYSPLGGASNVDVLGRREVRRIAEKYGRTPAQVAMRWLVQQRVGAVSATANRRHTRPSSSTPRAVPAGGGRHGGVVGADLTSFFCDTSAEERQQKAVLGKQNESACTYR